MVLGLSCGLNLSLQAQESSVSGHRWFKQLGQTHLYPEANPFKRCQNEFGFPIIQDRREQVLTDCQPEVVYSWGSAEKAKEIF